VNTKYDKEALVLSPRPEQKGHLVDRSELINELLKKNVNEHTEKKNNLTYLSWAWAWAEALKADSSATYKVEMFGDKCFMDINGTAMVFVTVTMFGKPMTCQLPVMDYRNKAIPSPDAFAVNTAIMRCMTKALSLHGLGLYIYAGEDCPQEEDNTSKPTMNASALADHLASIDACESLESLQKAFKQAIDAAGGDTNAKTKIIAAKDAKKGALK
jgi:hypothetical protein